MFMFRFLFGFLLVSSLISSFPLSAQVTFPGYGNNNLCGDTYVAPARLDGNLSSPAANTEVTGIVTVRAFFTVNYGSVHSFCRDRVKSRETTYSISGGPLDQSITSSTNSIDTSSLIPGEYTISASATYTMEASRYRSVPSSRSTYQISRGISRKVNVVQDVDAPELDIIFPITEVEVRGISRIRVKASDDSGIEDIQIIAGNSDLGIYQLEEGSNELDITYDTRLFPDGILLIQVRATDNAGNSVASSVPVVVDNIDDAPEISFRNLFDNQAVTGVVNIRTDVFDDRGIQYVKFFVDGEAVATSISAPHDAAIDTERYENGPHQISALAVDTKGEEISTFITLVFQNGDFKNPIARIKTPGERTRVKGDVTIQAEARDESGIERVEFYVGTQLIDTITVPSGGASTYQTIYDTTQVRNGIYGFRIVAFDKAGNFAIDNVNLVVQNSDDLNASVFITKPSPNEVISGFFELEALAVDNVAVREVRFLIDNAIVGATKLSPYTYVLDTVGFVDGAYTLTVQAYDYSNNFGEVSIPFRIDNVNGGSSSQITEVGEFDAIRGYSAQITDQIDLLTARRSTSSEMADEFKIAFNDLMKELRKEIRSNKRSLRSKKATRKIPRLARKARKALRRALKKGMRLKAMNRAKARLGRIMKALS